MRRLAVVMMSIALLSCAASPKRANVGIGGGRLTGPSTLQLQLNICHAQERRVKVSERADTVVVRVTAKSQSGDRDMCADGLFRRPLP